MNVENWKCTMGPILPPVLSDRIKMIATCDLLPSEIQAFNDAFHALAIALSSDPSAPRTTSLTVIFADTDSFTLTLKDRQSWGLHFCIAFYPLHLWREQRLSYLVMLIAALEELCHHFWSIEDEIEAKDKVTSLIQLLYPRISRNDLYKPDWSPDDHP